MRVSKRVGEGKPEGRCTETGGQERVKLGVEAVKIEGCRTVGAAYLYERDMKDLHTFRFTLGGEFHIIYGN